MTDTNNRRRNLPYNPVLKDRAKELRQHMTLSEVLLWKKLKGRQMCGCDFDRQRPIDEYIVDFFCKELRLAIEIDGSSHDFKKEKDQERQRRIESYGVEFLRFWDSEVKNDMNGVLARIEEWIRERRGGEGEGVG